MRLNIINGRSERRENLLKELKSQGITDYELWDGVYLGARATVKATINASHKQIVRYAKMAEWDSVIIAEDDITFTNKDSWNYFLINEPDVYDIYLGMIYLGSINDNNIVKEFTGLTLYSIKSSFYEKFLSVPDEDHIDRLISDVGGVFKVCRPFVCKQLNGFSSNTGKDENYDDLLKNREFL